MLTTDELPVEIAEVVIKIDCLLCCSIRIKTEVEAFLNNGFTLCRIEFFLSFIGSLNRRTSGFFQSTIPVPEAVSNPMKGVGLPRDIAQRLCTGCQHGYACIAGGQFGHKPIILESSVEIPAM